ncbi:MAG TPA: hypothetical protein IAC12_08515 [Candidatus Aphodovivens avistercoris]|nr:hypothetical protein [Candidatus Aphodovivens avistercoris]
MFTVKDLLEAASSKAAAKQQLKLAAASGAVERVRRGLYVSKARSFASKSVDPFEVIAALDSDAVLSYLSAPEAHGVAHNIGFEHHFRTTKARAIRVSRHSLRAASR